VATRRASAERPSRLGYLWACIFTAVRPATGENLTLVPPKVDAAAMQVFLDHVAASRPADVHLVMVLDGAGWHVSHDRGRQATVRRGTRLSPHAQPQRTR
jgi:hypothetical protein